MKAGAVLKKVSTYLALSALIIAVIFVWNARKEVSVSQVDVHVNSLTGDNFMDEKDVQNLVYTRIDTLLGLPVGRLRLREVESLVEGEPVVKNAEVYVGNNGVVHLEVELKKVVARIKPDSTVGFYVDDAGKVMPWVANISSDATFFVMYEFFRSSKLSDPERRKCIHNGLSCLIRKDSSSMPSCTSIQ